LQLDSKAIAMHVNSRLVLSVRTCIVGVSLILCANALHANTTTELPRKTQLGVGIQPLTPEERSAIKDLTVPESALKITAVSPVFTAGKAGIKAGDILLSINGESPKPSNQMQLWVSQQKPGSAARFALIRDGKPLALETTWFERPREPDNDLYRVRYESVISQGARMRTIVTIPAKLKPGERAPAMLLIPGVSLMTLDVSLTNQDAYSQIIASFAKKGFVTMRVEKPGIGDSEGAPALDVDFLREGDAFRQGLKALMARPDVDPKRVLVIGHSMGGLWAPLIVGDIEVKAVAVGGTVFRNWYEYMIETVRRQHALGGKSAKDIDTEMRDVAAIQRYYLNDGMTPEAIAEKYPTLKDAIAEDFPTKGYAMGRSHAFWHQVAAQNLPALWEKVNAKTLVFYGESEFVASEIDHPLLVDWLNSKRVGSAKYVKLPSSDHGFNQTSSPADSFAKWGKPGAAFNPNINDALHAWLAEISF
jgi:uncharacterized protein